jgi:hypothetical protein
MSSSTSSTNALDQALVLDAVQALLKYERKRQTEAGAKRAKLIDDLAKYIVVQVLKIDLIFSRS